MSVVSVPGGVFGSGRERGRGEDGRLWGGLRSRRAPPARSGFTILCLAPLAPHVFSTSCPKLKSAMTRCTSPSSPSSIIFRIWMLNGKNLVQTASIKNSFFSLAVSINFFACAALTVNAFSHSTCFPAKRHSMVFWKWWECGVAT